MSRIHRLFVIIVTYNGEKWIYKCLKSVYSSNEKSNVIVIDNKSTDNTVAIINQNFPDVILMESSENLGFGKANNVGIKYAIENNADYIYLLNQDAWVNENTFSLLIKEFEADKKWAIISPLQLNAKGDKVDRNFIEYTLKTNNKCISDFVLSRNHGVYDVSFVMAAHWMIRVEYLKNVGGFSDIFPHYGEDNNLVDRFLYWNYAVGICTDSIAYHDREDRIINSSKRAYLNFISLLVKWNNINISNIFNFIIAYIRFCYYNVKFCSYRLDISIKYFYKSSLSIFQTFKNRNLTKQKGLHFINKYSKLIKRE